MALPEEVREPKPNCASPLTGALDHRSTQKRSLRLLEPIGHVPPAEAEAAYYAALEEPAALAA